jgi:hypothetical protein
MTITRHETQGIFQVYNKVKNTNGKVSEINKVYV